MPWDLSCPDWVDRLKTGRPLIPERLPLDRDAADTAVAAFNLLRLADVPGTPRLADAAGDWFRGIVRAIFGSIDRENGERHIREVFALTPKKQSKTSYGALLMLTALLLNQRPRATFVLTAPVQDVADLAFSQISGAIALDPVLEAKLHVRNHVKTIVHRQTKAELAIMTFDPAVLTGQKVSGGALIDELHVVSRMAKAGSAIRQLRGGMMPFPEAFLLFITTQSEEPPAGVFRAELMKARAIRDGRLEGSMLPVLYEFPETMQKDGSWKDPATWPMVTPNLGRSITLPRLVEAFEAAETAGQAELIPWASQHLNVEVGIALHTDRWAGADQWEAAGDESVTLEALLERSDAITAGIDGGGLDDLLSLAFVGRDPEAQRWLHWSRSWAHPIVRERNQAQAQRFADFESDGDLVFSEITEDVAELAELVLKVYEAGLLSKIGVDPVGIDSVIDALEERGIPNELIEAVSQGWKLAGAIKTTERRLADGSFRHGGRRIMAWAVGNARVEPRGNAVSITKQTAGNAKIDPLMATFDAVYLMAKNPPPARGGVGIA